MMPLRAGAALNIEFDYSYDSGGFFSGANVGRRAILEAVATYFETRLVAQTTGAIEPAAGDSWELNFENPATGAGVKLNNPVIAANTIRVYVGARDLAATGLGHSGYSYSYSGSLSWVALFEKRDSTLHFEPFGGSISFNSSSPWYFDSDPQTLEDFSGKYDFFSVAMHELAHLLGFARGVEAYNANLAGRVFAGPHVVALLGGPAPLAGDLGHWQQNLQSEGREVAMDPVINANLRKTFTALDFAALQDIGYTVNAPAAAVILAQPQSSTVNPGVVVSLRVTAAGAPLPAYQWRKGGENIPFATGATYLIPAAAEADEGSYDVVVTNTLGTVTSAKAVLTVNNPVIIGQQPQSLTLNAGETARFSVLATGTGPLSYQWTKNGGNIGVGTAAALSLSNVKASDAGVYVCVVKNAVGNVWSAAAELMVRQVAVLGTPVPAVVVYGGARLSGEVNPGGWQTTAYFEYGLTTAYGSSTSSFNAGAGFVAVTVPATVAKLAPAATYHFRLVAQSSMGTSYGPDQSFTTPPVFEATADMVRLRGLRSVVIDVLANDVTPWSEGLFISAVTPGGFGSVAITADQTLRYTPGAGFAGSDDFQYSVTDGAGNTFPAQVHVRDLAWLGAGNYTGLVLDPQSRHASCGALRAALTRSGSFTGSLRYAGVRYPLSGVLDVNGRCVRQVPRAGLSSLLVDLALDPGDGQLSGSVSDGTTTSAFVAKKSAFSLTARCPMAGVFTVSFPAPAAADGALPSGSGYGLLKISRLGRARFSGRLGDAQRVSFSGLVTSGGQLPVYSALYGRAAALRGSIFGTADFAQSGSWSGPLVWFKPPQLTGKFYRTGFAAATVLSGERYLPATPALRLADSGTNADLTLEGGNLEPAVHKAVSLTGKGAVVVPELAPEFVRVRISSATGIFRGSFRDGGGVIRSIRGALNQKENAGEGFFVGEDQTGRVGLVVRPAQ